MYLYTHVHTHTHTHTYTHIHSHTYTHTHTHTHTGNPSSPGIVIDRLPEVTNTNVEVFWLPSQDTGGRNDFHYNVYVLLYGSTSFERRNDEPIVPATNDSNTVISYTIRNLNPEASYTIIVVASNGATNDGPSIGDLATVRDRFILFQIVAGEEAPSE